jgi:hypothetical protein
MQSVLVFVAHLNKYSHQSYEMMKRKLENHSLLQYRLGKRYYIQLQSSQQQQQQKKEAALVAITKISADRCTAPSS